MSLAPLLNASPAIQLHTISAAAALVFSAAVFAMPKGTPRHRWLGRMAAAALVLTALSSFWIFGRGGYSWIHILSLVTLTSITCGLVALWRGKRRLHARFMRGAAMGLAIAALFTVTPGRLLHQVVFGG